MSGLTITPVCVGTLERFEKSLFTYGRNFGVKVDVPCIIWVIRDDRRTVIVDCGAGDPAMVSRYHPSFVQRESERTATALGACGIATDEVDLVVLSHLHWDHCGDVRLFPSAQFLVQDAEVKEAIAPLPTQRAAYDVGVAGATPAWLSVLDRLETVSGVVEIGSGIRTVPLPGHTPGLQGVEVDTQDGEYLIATDALPLYENWRGDAQMAHIPGGIHFELACYMHTLTRMERYAHVLPGHDPAVLEQSRYPQAGPGAVHA